MGHMDIHGQDYMENQIQIAIGTNDGDLLDSRCLADLKGRNNRALKKPPGKTGGFLFKVIIRNG
jgi:hypothetical protein